MSLQGVIFDHDGTLVDTEGFHFKIWQSFLLDRFSIDFQEPEYIHHCSGVPTMDNAHYLIEVYQLDISAEQLCSDKVRASESFFEKHTAPLLPNVQNCLEFCQQHFKLAIATGADRAAVTEGLTKHNLIDFFQTIATSDDVQNPKPAGDVYQLALDNLALSSEQAIAIEDSPTGIAAAKAAGLRCVAVPNTYSKYQDLSQADFQIQDLGELEGLIAELNPG